MTTVTQPRKLNPAHIAASNAVSTAYAAWQGKQREAKTYDQSIAEPHFSECECLRGIWDAARVACAAIPLWVVDTSAVSEAQNLTRVGSSHGTVKRWFADKGYGYIRRDDGHEVYFNRTCLVSAAMPVKQGDRVTFGTVMSAATNAGQQRAKDVRVDGWQAPAKKRYEPTAEENAALEALKAQQAAARKARKEDRERREAGNAAFLRVAGE